MALDYLELRKLRLGGCTDAVALSAIGGAALLSSPFFTGVSEVAVLGVAALGGVHLAHRYLTFWREREFLPSTIEDFRSDEVPVKVAPGECPKDALLLGYASDTGMPVYIPDDDLTRHVFICGASGTGKTVLGRLMMLQQIQRGGGLLFIDGKLNEEEIRLLHRYCVWAGREKDLYVINPGDPEKSHKYNSVAEGDSDEVSARILSLVPETSSNAGADHYKMAANQGLTVLVAALKSAGLTYNFIDLSILLMSDKALKELEDKATGDAKTALQLFLDQYRLVTKEGTGTIDLKRLKETFGGIGGRMFQFGTGQFGLTMNEYSPDLTIFDAIVKNKIVYCALPTMGKQVAAESFGKLMVGDLRSAIAKVQALPEHMKPSPFFMCFFDEAGSYVNSSWGRMFEQARSARILLCPAVQTLANLEQVDEELKEMILGNTWVKIFFKLSTTDTAEQAAELIGKYNGVLRTLSQTDSESQSSQLLKVDPDMGVGAGSGVAFGEREEEKYRITVQALSGLNKGEIVITYGGSKVYKALVPMPVFIDSKAPEFRLMRYKRRPRNGIDLFGRAHQFLSKGDRRYYSAANATKATPAGVRSRFNANRAETRDEDQDGGDDDV